MSNPKHGRWWDDLEPAPEPPQQWEEAPRAPGALWGGLRWYPWREETNYQAPLGGERAAWGERTFWWTGARWLPLPAIRKLDDPREYLEDLGFAPDGGHLYRWVSP